MVLCVLAFNNNFCVAQTGVAKRVLTFDSLCEAGKGRLQGPRLYCVLITSGSILFRVLLLFWAFSIPETSFHIPVNKYNMNQAWFLFCT